MTMHMVNGMKPRKLLPTLPLKEQQGHSEPVQDLPVLKMTQLVPWQILWQVNR
jgi:hypothetical protein